MLPARQYQLRSIFLFLVMMALVFSTASAQEIYEQYEEGIVTFEYLQWPFGGMEGTYLAEGPVWNPDLTFPEGQDNGCGGGIAGAVGDTTRAIAIGAIDNPDGTRDAAVVFVTFPEGPALGVYPVDTVTMSAGFVWIDDVANLTMPEEGDDYQLWFDNLEADHKFGSTSGSIYVTAADTEGFSGTFSGMMGDPDDYTILTISNGQFEVLNVFMAPVPVAMAPAHLAAAPNPFNPQTTVKLSLDQAGSVVVGVFDLAGRRVADLHGGLLDEGEHQWVWNGMNDAGVPQSGGVYFCRAEGRSWSASTKLVLVP
jgi:hypothetical protein